MKLFLIVGCLLGAFTSFAGYEVIGKTDELCPIDAKVLRVKDKLKDELLLIEQRRVLILKRSRTQSGMSYFISEQSVASPPTFEALIARPEMSRLSELKVFLSGRMVKCLIEI